MYYSLGDHFRIGSKRPLDDKRVERMRGVAWLLNAVNSSGLEPPDFAERYVDRGRSVSGLMRKWRSGETHPVRHSALQVERLLPGTLWVFDLDVWDLLKNVPISSRAVARIISKYSERNYWNFPLDAGPRPSRRPALAEVMDTQRLVYRGDYWGFLGSLAVARLYESSGNDIKYISALKDVFRALPGALKEPWLRPLGEDLMDQLLGLKARRFYISLMFGVDERVIFNQADNSAFEPHRDWWPIDPSTGKAVEPQDPIVLSDITPSLGVVARSRTPPLAALDSQVGRAKLAAT
jgi:hypothetical protein